MEADLVLAQCKGLLGTGKLFGTVAFGTASVTVAALTILHLGNVSWFSTTADFGVDATPRTGNSGGMFGANSRVSTIGASLSFIFSNR